jgi:CelD/BcsL family acetyltransferase involved in cellulose biosynthesis
MIMAKVDATLEAAARPDPVPARTDAPADAPIRLSIHHDLDAVEQEWRAFEAIADCTAFQTFDWLAAWQRHIGARAGVTPAIVVGHSGARMLFLMPLAVEPGLVRRLAFLGSDLCDYNAPLLAPDFARHMSPDRFATLWREIVAALQQHAGFDLVDFPKMPETIGGAPNPLLALGAALNPSGAHLTRLHGTWDEFYTGKRSSATRRRDRTKRKRLSDLGEVCFVNPERRDDIALTLDTLIAQKTKAFARMGVANIFARPGQREFYLDVATNARDGLVHMSRLEVGSTIAATNLGLSFRGCYYYLLASYDDGPTSRFGPGMALLHDLMRRAIELKFDAFDFTIGDESYKLDWSDTELKLYDHVSAASLRGAPIVTLAQARRGLKRWIKQTPALWRAVTKVRALAGSWRRKAPADEPVQMDDSPPTSPR